ncbi:glutamine--tRNA ligase/YqeY domain fusion protein [Oceanithermus profundus]
MPVSRIPPDAERLVPPNFITEIIDEDLRSGKYDEIVTRFPPEPNGFPHIGHAIASFIDCGIARDYRGRCHLRMDDTNPLTEEMRYVEAIKRDMAWLGWDWGEHFYFASDYFDRLYEMAEQLIKEGKAYVDSLSEEEIREYRGTVEKPGRPSPYRERSVEENLDLFRRMAAGEFEEGAHVLRAKIDMSAPNMKLRDPILYRILKAEHYRTGDRWKVYPMYDFAHPLSDYIEGVTHSLCSSEFIDNRAVYDWLVENLAGKCGLPEWPRPKQIEFGRRSLEYTVVSKRKLIQLVERGLVDGWDDPRLPTLAGLRRRGVRPQALIAFARKVGISRTDRTVDIALLEWAIRDDLNPIAPRVMAVTEPLKLVLTNYPEGNLEELEAPYFPPDVGRPGSRKVPFGRELWVERSDFALEPPKGWKRLVVGGHTRLRHAYVVRIDEAVTNDAGEVVEVRGVYLPDTLGKNPEGVKVKGAVHWVAAAEALAAEFRLYDRLFKVPFPDAGEGSFLDHYNPDSLKVLQGYVEPSVATDDPDTRYQFERLGYFWRDPERGRGEKPVFNRIITLKDTWKKAGAQKPEARPEPRPDKKTGPEDKVAALAPEAREVYERCRHLGVGEAEALQIARDERLRTYLEDCSAYGPPALAAPWVVHVLGKAIRAGEAGVEPQALMALLAELEKGAFDRSVAKQALEEALARGGDPLERARARAADRLSAEALAELVREVLAAHPDEVAAYRAGKRGLMGFFVGRVMRASEGRADPKQVQSVLSQQLDRGSA